MQSDSDVEIEVGCSECPKIRERLETLQKTLDEKVEKITALEE